MAPQGLMALPEDACPTKCQGSAGENVEPSPAEAPSPWPDCPRWPSTPEVWPVASFTFAPTGDRATLSADSAPCTIIARTVLSLADMTLDVAGDPVGLPLRTCTPEPGLHKVMDELKDLDLLRMWAAAGGISDVASIPDVGTTCELDGGSALELTVAPFESASGPSQVEGVTLPLRTTVPLPVSSEVQVQPASPTHPPVSFLHDAGQCKPCAWFWKSTGCRNGDTCSYCHLCPSGELKTRKKLKVGAMRKGAKSPVAKSNSSSQISSARTLRLQPLLSEAQGLPIGSGVVEHIFTGSAGAVL